MRRALKQYQNFNLEAEINSASPYRITQMLFEGCIRFLKLAKVAVNNKDFEKKAEYISKAEAIIASLAATVDTSHNEDLGSNLINLYDFCLESLLAASVEMNADKIDAVEKIISEIKAGWDQIPQEEVARSEMIRQQNSHAAE